MSSEFIRREDTGDWAPFEMASFKRARAAAPPENDPKLAADRIAAAERDARERGHAAGLAEGRAAVQRLDALARALASHAADFEARYAEAVLDLALEVARQLLHSAPEVAREALLPLVREAMRALPPGLRRPRLFVHPADAQLLRASLADELEHDHWRVIEDAAIEPGGFRIESEAVDIDATLATRWKHVVSALGRETGWETPPQS